MRARALGKGRRRAGSAIAVFGLLLLGARGPALHADPATDAGAIRKLEQFQLGGDGSALDEIARRVAESRADPAARARIAGELASVLSSPAPAAAKQFACRQLVYVAGTEQVPPLAALLREKDLAHYALMALAVIPGRVVDEALLKALPGTGERVRLDIMDALADRGNRQVMPDLVSTLLSRDAAASELAAFALARLPGPASLEALRQAFEKAGNAAAPGSPGAGRAAIGDALLELAARTRGAGRTSVLRAVEVLLDADRSDPELRAAALRLMVESRGARALPFLAAALGEDGSLRQKAAAKLAREVPGREATRFLGNLLATLTPRGKVLVIEALADRGDPAAGTALAAVSSDPDTAVRAAALRALGRVGHAAVVGTLLRAAASGDAPARSAARAALAELRDAGVNARLTSAMATGPVPERLEAIRAVGERQPVDALPQLLQEAASPDPAVSAAALHVLRDAGGQSELQRLISLLPMVQARARDDLVDAVTTIARRGSDEQQRSGALLQALSGAHTAADRGDLLAALGQVGGPSALRALQEAAANGDQETKATALGVLAEWQTDEPMPDLLRLALTPAANADGEKIRTLALRGYIRMIGLNDQRPAAASLALYREAGALASRADEKRQLLAGLGKLGSLDALEYTETFLKDTEVRPEAELAVVGAAAWTAGAYREQTRGVLEPLARESTNEDVRKRAAGLLSVIGHFGDFVTAWEVTPAYVRDGADYTRLFDLVFPPEEPGSQIPWRLMPAGTNPQQPWLLDLLALLGGEQRVAYLRTAVWSDSARDVVLELGSDDGVKAWWNGQVVLAHNTARAAVPGEEKVKVSLKPGWNHLLLKITQNNQGWGAVARFVNPDGSTPAGLRFAVPSAKEVDGN